MTVKDRPLLQTRMDSELSFGIDVNEEVVVDPINNAVAKEAWYKVSALYDRHI